MAKPLAEQLVEHLRDTAQRIQPTTRMNERLEEFLDLLQGEHPNIHYLRGLCFHGLPDQFPALRAIVWKLVLRYLSPDKTTWDEALEKNRKVYFEYCKEFIREPAKVRQLREGAKQIEKQRKQGGGSAAAALESCPPPSLLALTSSGNANATSSSSSSSSTATPTPAVEVKKDKVKSLPLTPVSGPVTIGGGGGGSSRIKALGSTAVADHPLAMEHNSEWRSFWQDAEIFDQINKDTFRTRPELSFFSRRLRTREARMVCLDSAAGGAKTPGGGGGSAVSPVPTTAEASSSASSSAVGGNEGDASAGTEGGGDKGEGDEGDELVASQGPIAPGVDYADMFSPKRHHDLLSRILFVYAKLNSGLQYIQGMNEVLAPIYYVVFIDPLAENLQQAEADTFFCFTEVMQEQRDMFCKALDTSEEGIKGKLRIYHELLKSKDPELSHLLEDQGIEPQFYAMRWIMLLLTQEFELPEVVRLWDCFLADRDKGVPLPFLFYVCVAMTLRLREVLMQGDFATNLKLLQHFPAFDIQSIISHAVQMRADDLVEMNMVSPVNPGRTVLPSQGGRSPALPSAAALSGVGAAPLSSAKNFFARLASSASAAASRAAASGRNAQGTPTTGGGQQTQTADSQQAAASGRNSAATPPPVAAQSDTPTDRPKEGLPADRNGTGDANPASRESDAETTPVVEGERQSTGSLLGTLRTSKISQVGGALVGRAFNLASSLREQVKGDKQEGGSVTGGSGPSSNRISGWIPRGGSKWKVGAGKGGETPHSQSVPEGISTPVADSEPENWQVVEKEGMDPADLPSDDENVPAAWSGLNYAKQVSGDSANSDSPKPSAFPRASKSPDSLRSRASPSNAPATFETEEKGEEGAADPSPVNGSASPEPEEGGTDRKEHVEPDNLMDYI
uniref:Rab-GAP TBC domain-containing protein n=1 Tax=Chromera velia CCMP2878 TaxID=1169474 RepID=A0A0G4F2E2_9ALVE|eukprot:Cvel_2626.t1-p1 / transcript=Cvel_2626.t1 / gene=Cvel_2626 / organism=Chromera_velia_CCMP2878 / gene_product=TBC1 domain family member 13, putative / transcript_product=TBC1 domain family member 13, putative / location=Cvel_scaffold104:30750-37244(-) / protein_length=903 / sequence_SO=supercontig / SO=protein_coding / is_pseudo=false